MNQNKQTGSVLIISLIMLLIISMIALNSIQSNRAESIMSFNFSDKYYALQLAERSLVEVEDWLVQEKITYFDLMGEGCIQNNCFNEDCLHGLCLTAKIDSLGRCIKTKMQPYADLTVKTDYPLLVNGKDMIVWDNKKYHNKINKISNDTKIDAKFIVEFVCFDNDLSEINQYELKNKKIWQPVFRVTVKAYGENINNKVMLQSLFMVGSL